MNLRAQHLAWLQDNPRPDRRQFEKTEDFDAALDRWLEAQLDFGGFAQWMERNEPPDLGALIAKYGSYSRIPREAWATYDNELRHWNVMRQFRSG